jgi:hypothetical protein
VKALVRAAALAGACLGAAGATAEADIIFTPFAGKTFAAQHTLGTSIPVSIPVDKQTWLVGASAAWLTDNILGAELDFGYAPRFFASTQILERPGSNVLSLTGNVLLTVPLSVTRDSLRPYISGGLGMLHAGVSDVVGFTEVDSNLLAFSVGGGAIGFVNRRAGVRFDLRHIRTTSRGVDNATRLSEPRLGFWRATVGVAIRY